MTYDLKQLKMERSQLESLHTGFGDLDQQTVSVEDMIAGANRTIDWADREKAKLDINGERTLEKINEKIFSSEPKQVRPTPMHDVRYIVNEFESRTLDGSKAQISGYASIFDKASQVLGGGFC